MPPFSLMSKSLGLEYAARMGDWHRADPKRMYTQRHGSKGTMDRYLKHKIFSDDVLEDYAAKEIAKHDALRIKYAYLSSDNPELYKQVLSERAKYFYDLHDSMKWKINSKKLIK